VFKHVPHPFQIFDDKAGLLRSYLLIQTSEIQRKVITLDLKKKEIIYQDFKEFLNPKCPDAPNDPLSTRYGGAFIDLNMDCRPDLLVESETQ
jgi:hypothetical protein